MKWNRFVEMDDAEQELPPERKHVLVAMIRFDSRMPLIAVGYMRFAAGDPECPYFVTPGVPSDATAYAWCDCLPDMSSHRGAWEGLL